MSISRNIGRLKAQIHIDQKIAVKITAMFLHL